ncbi:hypothetical protein [Nocardioides ganghwensis]|uniref:Uncharacterized protein n=1 Tax=Nocardioides ganghwensis TaxID=252230 RepID=A0A4Q2SI14_9ACTN|nr:hypothetical protein [Nocardioides ganghwensis]MBD3946160.1 hypothetical protein [Nocardioides ganghwensis]RYC03498.1 hypothetical protein EUA07_05805 [Nocardioides ganghwensis]
MRMLRVCMYGGTDLDGMPAGFVQSLAEEILMTLPSVLVTGGFLRRGDRPQATSTDSAALEGARRAADRLGKDLRTLFEAWVPEGSLDGRPDVDGVVRMGEDLGVTVRMIAGRTALGRRLSMVGGVDVVLTVAGKRNTEVVLEQAIDLGVPALPIPHTGGDSKKAYETYGDRIEAAFAPGEVERCFALLNERGLQDPAAVRSVVEVIRSARVGRCLVLQPYREDDDERYSSVIRPTVEEQMEAVRLKDVGRSEQIYSSFFDAVANSTAIIADITAMNDNVMYEVGYAHGRGLQPLLYTLDPARIGRLPVYFRTLNVHTVSEDELPGLIRDYLRHVKHRQVDPMALSLPRQRGSAPDLQVPDVTESGSP